MKTEISRFVEDLSMPGQPRLGRDGWSVDIGRRSLALVYDDPTITNRAQARAASWAEAEARAVEIEEQAKVSRYFARLPHEKRAQIRREYNRIDNGQYPSVAHFAHATRADQQRARLSPAKKGERNE